MTAYSSKAIALKYIKYGDSSIISKMLTLEKGLQSFIVKGVRQKKSKQKLICFEPLKLSEILVNHKENSNLQYLKKIDLLENMNYNYINPNASLLSIFIAEIILKTTKENFADKKKKFFEFSELKRGIPLTIPFIPQILDSADFFQLSVEDFSKIIYN